MHNYEKIEFYSWKEFDFLRRYMVEDVFETLAAHNGIWNYPQYTMDIESNFLMKCKDYDIHGYKNGMEAYNFGDIQLKFNMHEYHDTMGEHDEIYYDMVIEFANFRCTSIQVIKDNTVLRQWQR